MKDIGVLPTELDIDGTAYAIESDYRACLAVLQAVNDPDLTNARKIEVCLMLYKAFPDGMPQKKYKEAYTAICDFLNHGSRNDKKVPVKIMDWEQDEDIMFPAINRAAGFEVRSVEYMHWWTFLGLLMSVDNESVWAQVLSLRNKKAKGKKLEKWEQEYWNANKSLCEIRKPETEEERQRKDELRALLGYK